MIHIQISCGSCHSILLNEDGLVYSFGNNLESQLGLGHKKDQSTPQIILDLENIRIKKISCGENHSILLSEEGTLYSFGRNGSGHLGLGNTTDQSTPQFV